MNPAHVAAGGDVVTGGRQIHEAGIYEQHERRVHFPPMDGKAIRRGERDRENVDAANLRLPRPKGAERLLVRIVPVRRQENKLLHPLLFPIPNQVVEKPVEGLTPDGGIAGRRPANGGIDAIFHGRRAQHLERGGEVAGQPFDDQRVASQRKVGTMLFRGTDRNDQAPIALQMRRDLGGA